MDVGVDLVLGGSAPAVHRGQELVPVARPDVLDGTQIGRHAGFEPGGSKAHGQVAVGVLVEHRAVAGEAEFNGLRRTPANRNRLFDHVHRQPVAPVLVEVRFAGLRAVDVDVLLVDAEDRQAEGDRAVVPDRDPGQRRLAGADQIEFRRGQVDDVAQRGHGLGAVRVVREQGPAGGRAAWRDRPVVAAFRSRVQGVLEPRIAVTEVDAPCAEPVEVECVGGLLEKVEVEALGHREPVVRLVTVAKREGLKSVVRQEPGPRELAARVPQQAVTADPRHRLGRPVRGFVVERLELRRHQLGTLQHQVDVGVHSAHPGSDDALRVRGVGEPLGVHVAAVEQQPRRPVLLHEAGTEDLGERALAAPPPEVDLPQAIASRIPALGEEQVVLAAGEDVGDAPTVDQDLDRGSKAGNLEAGGFDRRLRFGRADGKQQGDGGDDSREPGHG